MKPRWSWRRTAGARRLRVTVLVAAGAVAGTAGLTLGNGHHARETLEQTGSIQAPAVVSTSESSVRAAAQALQDAPGESAQPAPTF